MAMNDKHFQKQILIIYQAVNELELMFPGRPFTPDGHMVGSIGECWVADAYDLDLMPPSHKGYDAISKNGVKVEIKTTQAERVSFRSCPEHAIVIKINKNGTFKDYFNGPGHIIWDTFTNKKMPSNGQHQISLKQIQSLNKIVADSSRLPRKAQ